MIGGSRGELLTFLFISPNVSTCLAQHCMAGQNRTLMSAFSKIFGVRVYAGTGYQNPVYRFNTGDYVLCVDTGCVDSGRP